MMAEDQNWEQDAFINKAASKTRKIMLWLNAIMLAGFATLLIFTFILRSTIDSYARDFVTVKTIEYANPLVEAIELGLQRKEAQLFSKTPWFGLIEAETTAYRTDPASYVGDLTRGQKPDTSRTNILTKQNPLLQKSIETKAQIVDFYNRTIDKLILELRIFLLCNIILCAIILTASYLAKQQFRFSLVWASILMLGCMAYSIFMYIDHFGFFKIMFSSYAGWGYLANTLIIFTLVWKDHGIQLTSEKQKQAAKEKSQYAAPSKL